MTQWFGPFLCCEFIEIKYAINWTEYYRFQCILLTEMFTSILLAIWRNSLQISPIGSRIEDQIYIEWPKHIKRSNLEWIPVCIVWTWGMQYLYFRYAVYVCSSFDFCHIVLFCYHPFSFLSLTLRYTCLCLSLKHFHQPTQSATIHFL